MKAYSYSRFSSELQRGNTSLERQQSLAEEWCTKNNIELATQFFEDDAVSGFTGRNVTHGELAKFIELVENKSIDRGSYLLVENLDRLTRLEPWEALPLLTKLVKTLGIIVVTLKPEQVFGENTTGRDLMLALVQMELAHEESNKKSERLKDAWQRRFSAIRENHTNIGRRVSNWLSLEGKGGSYTLNDNAKAVKRIFELCVEGYGSTAIAQVLNSEGYETFNKGKRWGTSAILTVLKNRAVIGEYTPGDGRGAISHFFPAVIDVDTFHAAQASINARKLGKTTKSAAYVNLWSKLVFCGACNSTMHIIQRSKFKYLMCANRRYGQCEGSRNVRLDESEDVLMATLLELDAFGLVKPDPEKITKEYNVIEGRILEQESKLRRWTELLIENSDVSTYSDLVTQTTREINNLRIERDRLKLELAGGERISWSDFRAKLDLADKAVRKRVNLYLHQMKVKVFIAEGYLVTQDDDAKAIFAVSNGKIGGLKTESYDPDFDSQVSGPFVPNFLVANSMALNIKDQLKGDSSKLVFRGNLTTPNGRGNWRTKKQ